MGLAAAGVAIGAGTLGLGIANSVSGPSGGSAGAGSGGAAPNIYIPNNLSGQDANFNTQQSYITGQSPWGTLAPEFGSVANNLYNDPYNTSYQNASNTAGATSGWAGNVASGGVGMLGNTAGMIGDVGGLYSQAANNPGYGLAMGEAQTGGQYLMNVGTGAYNQGSQLASTDMGMLPAAANTYNATVNNPYNAQTIGAAAQGGQLMQGQALTDYGNAASMSGAGNSILNTAFDPQQALYNQQFQLNTDQTRAGLEARGLDTSAAGQGIENNSDQNFNIAWQNAQLGRQAQGLSSAAAADQTASSLGTGAGTNYATGGAMPGTAYTGIQNVNQAALGNYVNAVGGIGQNTNAANSMAATGAQQTAQGGAMGYNLAQQNTNNQIAAYGNLGNAATTYGNMYTQGAALGNSAATLQQNAGAMPYNASQTIYGNQGNALNNYQQAYNTGMIPYQQSIQNSLNYMNNGTNAGNAYASAARGSWAQGQQANQAFGAGLQGLSNTLIGNQSNSGGLLGQASNLYNNWNSGGSSNGGGGSSGYSSMGDLSNYPSYTPVTTTDLAAPTFPTP
jgi:hypothetical protein